MDARKALAPVEFRFGDPADVERFGDRWFRYSEGDLIRLPARDLIHLEGQLGMPIVEVMNGMRASTILGDTAAAWLGIQAEDPNLAGPFDEFNPITMLITWRKAEAEGKDEARTEPEVTVQDLPESEADGSPEAGHSQTPAPPTQSPTVILPTLPIAG
jgi:hypothetical protein